ncbi:haloalkane dehalogenase 3, partial [Mycobacterium tuberculosis variant bovis B2 7505]
MTAFGVEPYGQPK